MANANKPNGLVPVAYLSGADWTGQASQYYIASNDANAFYIGDPVTLSGDGDAIRGIPGVTIGTAGNTCVGVIIAIGTVPFGSGYFDPNNLSRISAPATKTQAYYVLVADDPDIIFEIQEDGVGGTLTSANIGQNANFIAGAPATGVVVSGYMLDSSSVNTTSTLNLKILGLLPRIDNAFGNYAKYKVLLNNHAFRTGVAGV